MPLADASGCDVLDVVALAQALVQIPSVNPMGRQDDQPEYWEHRVTGYLEQLFRQQGWPSERHEVHPGRENIVARLEGTGPLVLFEVHQDTVPVLGMTIEPFAAAIRDGRVYGRGACDIKGSMAAMIAAISRLAKLPASERPTIVLACTVNEEHGFTGATHLAQLWETGRSRLLPRAPDAAIVAEPTMLDVINCHKGVVRWRCTTRGRAAHSSSPDKGVSAIYRMAPVIAALERYARDVVGTQASHPQLGRSTLSVGTIAGGLSVNTVPAECSIEIDRRVIPGEDPLAAWKHVADYIAAAVPPEGRPEHAEPFIISPGLAETGNQDLTASVLAAMQRLGRPCRAGGVPFGTDAAAFGHAVPSIVFGPGSIDQAHTADEWIAIEQLELGVEAYVEIARELRKSLV